MGPRVHHLEVRPQVGHQQHDVQSVRELAKSGAMRPAVDEIVPIVLAVVVPGVIWNRVCTLQVLEAIEILILKNDWLFVVSLGVRGTRPKYHPKHRLTLLEARHN